MVVTGGIGMRMSRRAISLQSSGYTGPTTWAYDANGVFVAPIAGSYLLRIWGGGGSGSAGGGDQVYTSQGGSGGGGSKRQTQLLLLHKGKAQLLL